MHTGKDVPGWVLVSLRYPDGKKKRSDNIMYTTKDRLLGGRVIMAEAFGGYSGKPAGVLNALRATIFCPNYKKVYFLFIFAPTVRELYMSRLGSSKKAELMLKCWALL